MEIALIIAMLGFLAGILSLSAGLIELINTLFQIFQDKEEKEGDEGK